MDRTDRDELKRDAIAKFLKWFPICLFMALPPFWELFYVFPRHITVQNWALACLYGYWTFGVGLALSWFGLRLYTSLVKKMSIVRCALAVSGFLCAMIALMVIESKLQDRWFDHLDSMTAIGFGANLMWQAFAKHERARYDFGKLDQSGNVAEKE